mmetsp:Transcript_80265/g.159532  ORF Transcript_80265/g.159532 Transcript_80265/m.159532 type:complete len:203 (+) Transcript_80265:350-958(+)
MPLTRHGTSPHGTSSHGTSPRGTSPHTTLPCPAHKGGQPSEGLMSHTSPCLSHTLAQLKQAGVAAMQPLRRCDHSADLLCTMGHQHAHAVRVPSDGRTQQRRTLTGVGGANQVRTASLDEGCGDLRVGTCAREVECAESISRELVHVCARREQLLDGVEAGGDGGRVKGQPTPPRTLQGDLLGMAREKGRNDLIGATQGGAM